MHAHSCLWDLYDVERGSDEGETNRAHRQKMDGSYHSTNHYEMNIHFWT